MKKIVMFFMLLFLLYFINSYIICENITDDNIDIIQYFKIYNSIDGEEDLIKYGIKIAKAYYIFDVIGKEIIKEEKYKGVRKYFNKILEKPYYKDYRKIFKIILNYIKKQDIGVENLENIVLLLSKLNKEDIRIVNKYPSITPFIIVYPKEARKFIKEYGNTFLEILNCVHPSSYPTLVEIFKERGEEIVYIAKIIKERIRKPNKEIDNLSISNFNNLNLNYDIERDQKLLITYIGLYTVEFKEVTSYLYKIVRRLFKKEYMKLTKYNIRKVKEKLIADVFLFLVRNLDDLLKEKKEKGIKKILRTLDQLEYSNAIDKVIRFPYIYKYYVEAPRKYKEVVVSFIRKYVEKGIMNVIYKKELFLRNKMLIYQVTKLALEQGIGVIQNILELIDKDYNIEKAYRKIIVDINKEYFIKNLVYKVAIAKKYRNWKIIDKYINLIEERGDKEIEWVRTTKKYAWIPGYYIVNCIRVIYQGFWPTKEEVVYCVADSFYVGLGMSSLMSTASISKKVIDIIHILHTRDHTIRKLQELFDTNDSNKLFKAFILAFIMNSDSILKLILDVKNYLVLKFIKNVSLSKLNIIYNRLLKAGLITLENIGNDFIYNLRYNNEITLENIIRLVAYKIVYKKLIRERKIRSNLIFKNRNKYDRYIIGINPYKTKVLLYNFQRGYNFFNNEIKESYDDNIAYKLYLLSSFK